MMMMMMMVDDSEDHETEAVAPPVAPGLASSMALGVWELLKGSKLAPLLT